MCFKNKTPITNLPSNDDRPISENCRRYRDSISSHGSNFPIFNHRFSGSSFPPKGNNSENNGSVCRSFPRYIGHHLYKIARFFMGKLQKTCILNHKRCRNILHISFIVKYLYHIYMLFQQTLQYMKHCIISYNMLV